MNKGELLNCVPPGVRLINLGKRRPRDAVFALTRYLNRERPDALLSSVLRANIAALVAGKIFSRKTRVVVREANRTEFIIKSQGQIRAWTDAFYTSYLYPKADAIIAVSKSVRDSLVHRHLSKPSHIHIIHNPITIQTQSIVKRINTESTPTLLACGRLAPEKDHVTLLRAFALLRNKMHAKLIVLGEGPLRSELQLQAEKLGIQNDVTFAGFVQKPLAYLYSCSIFVHTSRFEGLPNVLLQAMVAGCPIVATDCPGGVREVLDDGKYGTLVPVGSHVAVAEAIEHILTGQTRFPNAADYLRQFDIEKIVDKYLSVLFPATRDHA